MKYNKSRICLILMTVFGVLQSIHAGEKNNENMYIIKNASMDEITGLKFCNQDGFIVSGSLDGTIKLRNRKGILLKTIVTRSPVNCLSSNRGGKDPVCLAAGFPDGSVKMWSFTSEKDLKEIYSAKMHDTGVSAIAVKRNGYYCVSGDIQGIINGWDNTKKTKTDFLYHTKRVNSIAISNDGGIISGGYDEQIVLWSINDILFMENGKVKYMRLFDLKDYVKAIDFNPDSRIFSAVGVVNEPVRVSLVSDDVLHFNNTEGDSESVALVYSPDGRFIASASFSILRLWSNEGKLIRSLPVSDMIETRTETVYKGGFSATREIGSYSQIDFSEDSTKLIIAAYNDKEARIAIWNLDNLK